ncbi:hypothetical protein [uncultured Corynebacterium sp.]|uniref:hypothetical protein n=1 Tax=uncultured Corynebacterium sp. TaxID=159447 RepID=UPI00259A1436|nr:hypothetical protein [uncultured Corynebacterium sp.]
MHACRRPAQLRDGKPLATSPDYRAGHFMRKHFFDRLEDSGIGELLHEYGLIQAAK